MTLPAAKSRTSDSLSGDGTEPLSKPNSSWPRRLFVTHEKACPDVSAAMALLSRTWVGSLRRRFVFSQLAAAVLEDSRSERSELCRPINLPVP